MRTHRVTWQEREHMQVVRGLSEIAANATAELEGLRREQHLGGFHSAIIESCPDCRHERWAKSLRETGHHDKCPNRPGGNGGWCGTECTGDPAGARVVPADFATPAGSPERQTAQEGK